MFTHSPCLDLMTSRRAHDPRKLISSELHQKSPTYGHVAKSFLESEFQSKGNKQTKKRKFSTKSCGFLGSNRFRNNNYLNTTRKRTNKKNWTKLLSLGHEPTFNALSFRGASSNKTMSVVPLCILVEKSKKAETVKCASPFTLSKQKF